MSFRNQAPDMVLPDGTQVDFKTYPGGVPESESQVRTYDDLVTAHEKEMKRLADTGEEVHGP